MAMRMSGLMSGMDTESLIQELVAARRTKVDTTKKAQTKLEWKQDAWKSLNTKLKNLQSKYVNNMRFNSSYSKRTTKVSNSSIVSVITGENAVNGVQSLQVKQLAKTAYLTGAEVTGTSGDVIATDTLEKLGYTGSGTINLNINGETTEIAVTKDTTISDFLTKVKDAGLNASFDAGNQRFFISAKKSGVENDFSFVAADADGAAALNALGLQLSMSAEEIESTYGEYEAYYADYLSNGNTIGAGLQIKIDATVASRVDSYLEQYKTLLTSKEEAQKKIEEINEKYKDTTLDTVANYKAKIEELNEKISAKTAEEAGTLDYDKKAELTTEISNLKKELEAVTEKKTDAETLETQNAEITKIDKQIADIEKYVTITPGTDTDGNTTYSAVATADLISEEQATHLAKAEYAYNVVNGNATVTATKATKIAGQDAIINLNGAEFTGNDNVFEINGLTFTALSETKGDETVTITTQDDVDGIYDMVKNFLKEYNSIISEMDKMYNAESAKGYEPLTDEEKEALSESEIEKYETKIKDALLRNDSNLSDIRSALKSVMSAGIEVNGKTMYLASFGIETQGYFEAADNEKSVYHIAGDEDDEYSSGKADVLKGMISSDPDTVISFFSQLSKNLYEKMDNLSSSVDGYRSYGSFYDDKKMKSDYNDYTTKIKELEDKLADYEDKWYDKFAAMETALAKMQSNTNAITSMLGGS